MNGARQAIRWSIPGWLLPCTVATLQTLAHLILFGPVALADIKDAFTAPLVAAFIAGGLPLGFLVYQSYHRTFGTVLLLDIVGHDRGGEVLSALPRAALTIPELKRGIHPDLEVLTERVHLRWFPNAILRLKPQYRNAAGRDRYRRRLQMNWEITRYLLNLTVVQQNHTAFKDEVLDLSDVYHALGATRSAIVLAYGIHFVVSTTLQIRRWFEFPWRMSLAFFSGFLLTALMLLIIERNRRHVQVSQITLLQLVFQSRAHHKKVPQRHSKRVKAKLPAYESATEGPATDADE